jgi:hypothetical protein
MLNSRITFLATVISIILHPLLLPTYLFAALGYFSPAALFPFRNEIAPHLVLLVFITTFALPAVFVLILKVLGFIDSFYFRQRKERLLPFAIICSWYMGITYVLQVKYSLSSADTFFNYFLVMDLLVIFAFLVTLIAKISIHSLALAGLSGLLYYGAISNSENQLFLPFLISLSLVGIGSSARLQLHAHSVAQVWFGILIGVMVGFFGGAFVFNT